MCQACVGIGRIYEMMRQLQRRAIFTQEDIDKMIAVNVTTAPKPDIGQAFSGKLTKQ